MDPFNYQQHIQEMFDKINEPYLRYLKSFNTINKNLTSIKTIQLQTKVMEPLIDVSTHLQKQISNQLRLSHINFATEQMNYISEQSRITLDQMRNLLDFEIRIPIEFQENIQNLLSVVNSLDIPKFTLGISLDELRDDFTQPIEDEDLKINWSSFSKYLMFIINLITFINVFYSSYQDDLKHKEQMLELEKQTNIQEQMLLIEQERLQLEKEQNTFHQEIEETLKLINQQLEDQIYSSDNQ